MNTPLKQKPIVRTISVFTSPKVSASTEFKLKEECSVYMPDKNVYFTADPSMDFVWFETELKRMQREVEEYKARYENIHRGLCYWKSRALRK